jgi:hypothetical protein
MELEQQRNEKSERRDKEERSEWGGNLTSPEYRSSQLHLPLFGL